MDCSKITNGLVGGSCADGLRSGGTCGKAWVFNFADIDFTKSLKDTDGTNLMELILKEGARGYIFESLENAIEGSATLNVGTYINTYDHQVTLRSFVNNASARRFLANAKDARVVIFLKTKEKVYNLEVYGFDNGLKLRENPYNTNYTDNVTYAPVFGTDENNKESNLPMLSEPTEAQLDALCQEPTQ